MKKYKLVACGGTFDLFHLGHREFLQFALSLGEKVVIGITSDAYVQSNKSRVLAESFEVRKKAVEEFVTSLNAQDRVEIVALDDPYGPTILPEYQFDALAVTNSTQKGGEAINKVRASKNLVPLPVEVFEMVKVEDGQEISSQRIRDGEINRDGRLFIPSQWLTTTLALPHDLRTILQEPFGTLSTNIKTLIKHVALHPQEVGTVGDVITSDVNGLKLAQRLSIIDFKVNRQMKYASIQELGFSGAEKVIEVVNPAGSITSALFQAIQIVFQKRSSERVIIKVIGEEDLAVLPLVLSAPLDFTILYGQPGKGVVEVVVSEQNKEEAYQLLIQFDQNS